MRCSAPPTACFSAVSCSTSAFQLVVCSFPDSHSSTGDETCNHPALCRCSCLSPVVPDDVAYLSRQSAPVRSDLSSKLGKLESDTLGFIVIGHRQVSKTCPHPHRHPSSQRESKYTACVSPIGTPMTDRMSPMSPMSPIPKRGRLVYRYAGTVPYLTGGTAARARGHGGERRRRSRDATETGTGWVKADCVLDIPDCTTPACMPRSRSQTLACVIEVGAVPQRLPRSRRPPSRLNASEFVSAGIFGSS
jgi:hypothetical protein